MKKKLTAALALLCSLTLLLSACGKTPAPANSNPSAGGTGSSAGAGTSTDEPSGRIPTNMIITSGSNGGGFYMIMTAMMDYLPKEISGLNVTGLEGAATENLRMVNNGDADVGTFWCDQFIDAINGTNTFEGEKLDNICAVQTCTKAMQYFMVRADSGINSVEDLVNAKGIIFSPGEVGSGLLSGCQEIFIEAGSSFEQFEANGNSIVYAGYSQFPDMLGDGQLDAFFIGGSLNKPQAGVAQAELTTNLKVIPIEGEWVERLCQRLPSYEPAVMDANVYKNQTEPVPILTYYTMVGCARDLDEEFVYNFTKANYDNIDAWKEVAPQVKSLFNEPSDFVKGFAPENLHPGAARFWKEIGAIQ